MKEKAREIVATLTLEEKARLCSGLDFWNTAGLEGKGVPSITLSDGPHGLRRQAGEGDHLGVGGSDPATCFPAAATLANSWDTGLMQAVGRALGDECLAQDVQVLLGPGVNIKRNPLCGRNFEYFSEDPYLASHMAAALIEGVQSRGVGCAVKHFAANNQESGRMTVDAQVEERALREIYLAAFEYAVKEARPWMVMAAYNRLNGAYCSENHRLLTGILREEWGFEGSIVSDWGAVDSRVKALASGMDLEMPYSGPANTNRIVAAVRGGQLDEAVLDAAAQRLVALALRGRANAREGYRVDYAQHHQLAAQAAAESMVLLKNKNANLPLRRDGALAVIGAFAGSPRIQGAGSSRVNPTEVDNLFEQLAEVAGPEVGITFAKGYSLENDQIDDGLVTDAVETAKQCENIIVIAGIPDRIESEGYDRQDMRLPENQNHLIEQLSKLRKRMVIVLVGGAPVELPWLDKVDSVLAAYLGGQAMADALARVLYGAVTPSGKLAETYPMVYEHNPSALNFPGDGKAVQYAEGIFVGYRYYEAKKIQPRFPFGHGLSYTEFAYSGLRLSKQEMREDELLTVCVDVTNTGYCAGKEIVQLYVGQQAAGGLRPVKELKAFDKVALSPRETKTVAFTLDRRAFAYYSAEEGSWLVDTGCYEIAVGASSADIRQSAQVQVNACAARRMVFTPWSTLAELVSTPAGNAVVQQMLGAGSLAEDGDLGVDTFELVKDMPLKKIIAMGGAEDADAVVQGILQAINTGG